jgi:hypothetical protein
MQKPFLTESQYQEILRKALSKQGLESNFIDLLIASRFPMLLPYALAECSARGIDLTEADCDEFLWALSDGPPKTPGGDLIEAKLCQWVPETVQALLTWASIQDRGTPSRTSAEIAEINRQAEQNLLPESN